MLDDFTEENGAILSLPESHLESEAPSDEEFKKKCNSCHWRCWRYYYLEF